MSPESIFGVLCLLMFVAWMIVAAMDGGGK